MAEMQPEPEHESEQPSSSAIIGSYINNSNNSTTFTLNVNNIGLINTHNSGKIILNTIGSNVDSNDVNKVYDYTSWASSHPGGYNNISKWKTSENNYCNDSRANQRESWVGNEIPYISHLIHDALRRYGEPPHHEVVPNKILAGSLVRRSEKAEYGHSPEVQFRLSLNILLRHHVG